MGSNRLLLAALKSGSVVAPTDSNFKNVAMLMHGNGASGAANNTFKATNLPTLSHGGNATEGTFTPYGANWSTMFDGVTGYLTATATSALAFGVADFTVETWVNLEIAQSNNALFIDTRNASNLSGWSLGLSGGSLTFTNGTTVAAQDASTSDIPLGSWIHVAYARQGTTGRLFVNGALVTTVTDSSTYAATNLYLGFGAGTGATRLNGYLSNLRVVNGTAVYTAAFTPSTSPLTAVTNTALLTCQSNRFLDNSTNAYAFTASGTVAIQRLNPFGDNSTPYSTTTYGGSCWFDGSSGFLQTGASSNFQLSGDFTFETWVYMPALVNTSLLSWWTFGTASSCAFMFQALNTGFLQFTYGLGATNASIAGTSAKIVPGAWNHVAITRQGSTVRFFVNGVLDATTGTVSGALNSATQPVLLGADNNQSGFTAHNFFSGYLTGLRLVNGTALYTASFTPSTSIPANVASTALLYNAQTAGTSGVYDNAMQHELLTVGTAQISSAQSKFSTTSLYFSGALANSVYPTLSARGTYLQLGSVNFTAEAWIYPTSASETAQIMGCAKNGTNSDWLFYLNAGKLAFHWNNSTDLTSTSSPAANAWSHVAAMRSGNTLYLFINGTQVGSAAMSGSVGSSTGDYFTVGADATWASMPFTGYMEDIRVTLGVARYATTGFTAPSAAFPNSISSDTYFNNVALLVHGTGQNAYANNVFAATMPSSQISLTSTGSPFEGTFTPYGSNWSTHLNGAAASYLTYGASTSAAPGNQTFTIEMWAMFETLPTTIGSAGEYVMWQKGRTGTNNFELALGVQVITGGAYQMLVQFSNGDGVTIVNANSSNISLTAGTWHHFAITQVGGSGACTFFFDGQLMNTFNHGVTNMYLGIGAAAIGNNNVGTNPVWGGHVSNVRVVFGSRVYTANFTPSTAPLTAITGTNFLSCQSNRWIDNSTNAWAISVGGTPAIRRFNPFGDNGTPYASSKYAGSCYFAGGGTNLSYAASSSFGFGTGAFTIECWMYMQSVNSNACNLVDLRSAVAAQATALQVNASGQLAFYDGPNNTVYSDSTALALNTWYHVALTRDNFGVWRLFKNGVQVATVTAADNLGSSQPILIGQAINGTTQGFNGFISDLRIVNGSAVYTATFTPPIAPLSTAVVDTSFLYNATDVATGVLDNALQQTVQTLGNTAIVTSQSKFNGSSIDFDGSNQSTLIAVPNNQLPVWSAVDWTVEGWWYVRTYSGSASNGFWAQRTSNNNYTPMMVELNNGVFQAYLSSSGSAWAVTISTSTTVTLNTWFHLALVRSGGTVTLYLNGVSIGSGSIGSSALMASTSPLAVGANSTSLDVAGNVVLSAFLNDFRITYGVARYTANFTPPTAAFPDQ
jgi:hypothetical protein